MLAVIDKVFEMSLQDDHNVVAWQAALEETITLHSRMRKAGFNPVVTIELLASLPKDARKAWTRKVAIAINNFSH